MELKPCPFCGSKPITWWDWKCETEELNEGYNIACNCCDYVHISKISKDEAIEAWNRRAKIED